LRASQSASSADLLAAALWLGILHVGAGVAKALGRGFATLDDLFAAGVNQLTDCEDVGEGHCAKPGSVARRFTEPDADRAPAQGWPEFQLPALPAQSQDWPVAGKTFVLTGTLPNLKREEAAAKIGGGGRPRSVASVSKRPTMSSPGGAGSKLDKAQKLA